MITYIATTLKLDYTRDMNVLRACFGNWFPNPFIVLSNPICDLK